MNKKMYQSPQTKVTKVMQTEIICGSPVGSFGVSDNGKVEEGSEEDWSDTNLDW